MFSIDFRNISQFSYFSGINPALQKTLFSIFLSFRGPNDVQMTYKFKGIIFWNEEGVGAKETKKWRPEGPGHRPTWPDSLAVWDPPFWPSWLRCCQSFFPKLPRDVKPTIKIAPRHFPEERVAETQKPQNRDLELQIGGVKLRRGAAGVVSISPNNISTVSMMKRE